MIKIADILKHYKSLLFAVIILSLSVVSTDEIAPRSILAIPYADKFVHFVLYSALSLILLLEFNRHFFSIYPGIVIPLAISIIYGGLIEIIQMFIPYRSADLIDFLFDIGGTLAGLAIFLLWRRIRY